MFLPLTWELMHRYFSFCSETELLKDRVCYLIMFEVKQNYHNSLTLQTMAWILDEYSKFHGYSPAVVTGKPIVSITHKRIKDPDCNKKLYVYLFSYIANLGSWGITWKRICHWTWGGFCDRSFTG